MCSTPQKQPAATVALAAPSGLLRDADDCGFRPRLVDVVKGRKSREMKEGIVVAMRMVAMRRRRVFERVNCVSVSFCGG